MKIKDDPLRQTAADGSEKKVNSLFKQRLNNFLINYFSYLILALSFIIFIVGIFLFIYPQYRAIAESNKTDNKILQAEYEAKDNYLSAIRDLKNSYQLISAADREKIESMVPNSDKSINLIPEIETIVLKNGAVLNYVKIEENIKDQSNLKVKGESGETLARPAGIFEHLPQGVGLTKVEISLSSVNYSVLKSLLKTFENNLWLLDIAKVDYDAQENKAIFTIYSYYLLR